MAIDVYDIGDGVQFCSPVNLLLKLVAMLSLPIGYQIVPLAEQLLKA
jgi:xanthosine utilization system XapX-like protein